MYRITQLISKVALDSINDNCIFGKRNSGGNVLFLISFPAYKQPLKNRSFQNIESGMFNEKCL